MVRELREAVAVIEAEGIRVLGTVRRGRHFILETDLGIVPVSLSPSDRRGILNFRAACRRAKARGTFATHLRRE